MLCYLCYMLCYVIYVINIFICRLDASNGIVAVRQEAMTQLRDVQSAVREENRTLSTTIVDLKGSAVEIGMKLDESEQELKVEKTQVEVTNTRNHDLLCRCNKLSDELQLERKARYVLLFVNIVCIVFYSFILYHR